MPEATEHAFRYGDVFNALDNVCRQFVLNDLRLMSQSARDRYATRINSAPVLTSIPRLRAALTFDVTLNAEKKLLFGLKKKKRSERIAEFDLSGEVRPSPSNPDREVRPTLVLGKIPDLIRRASTGGITIHLPDGGEVTRRLARPGMAQTPALPAFETQELGQLFVALARWNAGELPADSRPIATVPGGDEKGLLRDTVSGVQSLLRNMAVYAGNELRDADADQEPLVPVNQATRRQAVEERRELERYIGEGNNGYAYQSLELRMRATLDDKGDIATEPFQPGSRRYDIVGKLIRHEGSPAFQFELLVPDCLSEGPIYRRVLELMGGEKLVEETASQTGDSRFLGSVKPTSSECRDFIASAATGDLTRVIRTRRHKLGKDHNFLLLDGQMRGERVLLGLRHRISFTAQDGASEGREVDRVYDLELVLSKVGQQSWRAHNSLRSGGSAATEYQRYFSKVFYALRAWKLRFL